MFSILLIINIYCNNKKFKLASRETKSSKIYIFLYKSNAFKKKITFIFHIKENTKSSFNRIRKKNEFFCKKNNIFINKNYYYQNHVIKVDNKAIKKISFSY